MRTFLQVLNGASLVISLIGVAITYLAAPLDGEVSGVAAMLFIVFGILWAITGLFILEDKGAFKNNTKTNYNE